MQFPKVQREEAYGYTLFFIGDDHLLPFVSIANKDQDADNLSQLDRPEAFRLNIGVSKATYAKVAGKQTHDPIDYAQLNTFLPHPHYAQYNFVCITSPSGENISKTKELIGEAHEIATARQERQQRVLSQQQREQE